MYAMKVYVYGTYVHTYMYVCMYVHSPYWILTAYVKDMQHNLDG